jgi:hypothetical protein
VISFALGGLLADRGPLESEHLLAEGIQGLHFPAQDLPGFFELDRLVRIGTKLLRRKKVKSSAVPKGKSWLPILVVGFLFLTQAELGSSDQRDDSAKKFTSQSICSGSGEKVRVVTLLVA